MNTWKLSSYLLFLCESVWKIQPIKNYHGRNICKGHNSFQKKLRTSLTLNYFKWVWSIGNVPLLEVFTSLIPNWDPFTVCTTYFDRVFFVCLAKWSWKCILEIKNYLKNYHSLFIFFDEYYFTINSTTCTFYIRADWHILIRLSPNSTPQYLLVWKLFWFHFSSFHFITVQSYNL